jgi:hypothetical protein
VDVHPNSAGVYYNMACVYARQNRKEEVVSSLKQAVDKGFKEWSLMRRTRT